METEERQDVEHQDFAIGSMTFIIKKVYDSCADSFYHQRYLDALASIFALERPAAAITYYPKTQRFYLSYNKNHADKTLKKKNIIQECLNKTNDPNQIKSLLFLYIAYNINFKELLKLSAKSNLFNFSGITDESIYISSAEFDSLMATNKEDTSRKPGSFKTKKEQLEEVQLKVNDFVKTLVDIINDINKTKRPLMDPTEIEALKLKENTGEQISENKQYLIGLYNSALKTYYKILDHLSDKCIETLDKSKNFYKFAKILVRPLQDVEKLSYYLKYKMSKEGLREIEVEIIPNYKETDKTKHAEANLSKEFSSLKGLSIGVSKLCCGLCDYVLNEHDHSHRGTHGTCDPDWGAPTLQYADLREEIYSKSADVITQASMVQEQAFQQHRTLSDDDLKALIPEPDLSAQDFLFEKYADTLLSGEID